MTVPELPSLDDTPLPSITPEMRDKAVDAVRVAAGFLWSSQPHSVEHYARHVWHVLDGTVSAEQRHTERSRATSVLRTLCDGPAYAAADGERPAMVEALHTLLRHDTPHIAAVIRSLWQSMRTVIEGEKVRGGSGPWHVPLCVPQTDDAALVDAAIWLFFPWYGDTARAARAAYEILAPRDRSLQRPAQIDYFLTPFAASNGTAQKVAALLRDLLLPVASTPDPRDALVQEIRAELARGSYNTKTFDPRTHHTLVQHAMGDGFGRRLYAEALRFVADAENVPNFTRYACATIDVTNDSVGARRSLQPELAVMIERVEFPLCPRLCEVAADAWRELLLRQATCADMPGTVEYLGRLNDVRDAMKRVDAELGGPERPWKVVEFNRSFKVLNDVEAAVRRAITCLWRDDIDAKSAAVRDAVTALRNSSAQLPRWRAQVAFAERLIEEGRSARLPAEVEAFDLLRTLVLHQDPDVERSTTRVLMHTVDEVFLSRTSEKTFTIWSREDCADHDEVTPVLHCFWLLAREAVLLLWPDGAKTQPVLDDVLIATGLDRSTEERGAAQARLHAHMTDARRHAKLDVEHHAFGLLADLLLYQDVGGLKALSHELSITLQDVRDVRRTGHAWLPEGMTQSVLPEPDAARLAGAIDRAAGVLAAATSFTGLEVEGEARALFVESARVATERGKCLQMHAQRWCRSFGLPSAEKALGEARSGQSANGDIGWGVRKVFDEADVIFATLRAFVCDPGLDTEARIARLDAASDAIERIVAPSDAAGPYDFTLWEPWGPGADVARIEAVDAAFCDAFIRAAKVLWADPVAAESFTAGAAVATSVIFIRKSVRHEAQRLIADKIRDARREARLASERRALDTLSTLLLYQDINKATETSANLSHALDDVEKDRKRDAPITELATIPCVLWDHDAERLSASLARACSAARQYADVNMLVSIQTHQIFANTIAVVTAKHETAQAHHMAVGASSWWNAVDALRSAEDKTALNARYGEGLLRARRILNALARIRRFPGNDIDENVATLDAASFDLEGMIMPPSAETTAQPPVESDRFRAAFLGAEPAEPEESLVAPIAPPESTMLINASAETTAQPPVESDRFRAAFLGAEPAEPEESLVAPITPPESTMLINASMPVPALDEAGWSARTDTSWSPGSAAVEAPSPFRTALAAAQLRVIVRQSRLTVQGALARAMGAFGAPGAAQAVARSDVFGALASGLACALATRAGHDAVAEELAAQSFASLGAMALDTFSGPLLEALRPLVLADEHTQEILPALDPPAEKFSSLWQGEQSPAPVRIIDAPHSEGDRDPDKE